MQSECLITGGCGLLGRRLAALLEERGVPARVLDLEIPAPEDFLSRLACVRGDVSDPDTVRDAARGVDTIFHLAAAQRMKPQFAGWSEDEIFRCNVAGVRNVLAAAEELGIRKVVYVSSSGVYGIPRTYPVREDHPTRPLGSYGRSKILGEELCREAVARGLDVTTLRPMTLFGPGMTGIFPMLFEWVRTDQPIYLMGRGRNRVAMSSARDVAEACLLAAERPEARGAVLNVAADPEAVPTVIEQVRALVAHAGSSSPIVPIPTLLLRSAARALGVVGLSPIVPEHYLLADRDFTLDIGEAKRVLGWTPLHDNVAMMNAAYDWYQEAGAAARPDPHRMLRLLEALAPGIRLVFSR